MQEIRAFADRLLAQHPHGHRCTDGRRYAHPCQPNALATAMLAAMEPAPESAEPEVVACPECGRLLEQHPWRPARICPVHEPKGHNLGPGDTSPEKGDLGVTTVTYFETLMIYARALAKARQGGDPVEIAKAQAKHDAYHAQCLTSDEMVIPFFN